VTSAALLAVPKHFPKNNQSHVQQK
jgi:hypothetical protein